MEILKTNIVYQYVLQIAKYLFPFITLPYLTRILGPDVYAVRAYIVAAMAFFQVFLDYGFKSYGTMAIAKSRGNADEMNRHTTCIMIPSAILCVLGLVALIAMSFFIPIISENLLYACIAYLGICFKANLPDFVFQGLEDMRIITVRFVVSQAVAAVSIVTLIKGPQDLLLVPIFETIASFIAFVWSWENVLIKRRISFVRVAFGDVVSTFRESTIFFLSNASTMLFTSLTTLMIGVLITDLAEVSYWSLAMTAITAIQSLYSPITNSLYPRMCVTMDFSYIRKFLIAGMIAVTVGCVAFVYLADVVMWVLGGDEYLDGAYVIQLVTPVLFFSYPAMLLGFPVLAAAGRTPLLTTSSMVSAGFHVVGLVALAAIGRFTIVSVSVLRCGTEFVLCALRSSFAYQVARELSKPS